MTLQARASCCTASNHVRRGKYWSAFYGEQPSSASHSSTHLLKLPLQFAAQPWSNWPRDHTGSRKDKTNRNPFSKQDDSELIENSLVGGTQKLWEKDHVGPRGSCGSKHHDGREGSFKMPKFPFTTSGHTPPTSEPNPYKPVGMWSASPECDLCNNCEKRTRQPVKNSLQTHARHVINETQV